MTIRQMVALKSVLVDRLDFCPASLLINFGTLILTNAYTDSNHSTVRALAKCNLAFNVE
jgi:hypothetical protein